MLNALARDRPTTGRRFRTAPSVAARIVVGAMLLIPVAFAVSFIENEKALAAEQADLDLDGLEQRLRSTKAIGLFAKLSLKKDMDKLVKDLGALHDGRDGATIDQMHERYDLLVNKVLSLVQDKDAELAEEISNGRESVWDLLADREKFTSLREG